AFEHFVKAPLWGYVIGVNQAAIVHQGDALFHIGQENESLLNMEKDIFFSFVWIWIAIAIIIFLLALFFTAPYGRHSKPIGPMMQNRWGWLIMELPPPVAFSYFFLSGSMDKTSVHWLFFILFMA